MLKRLVWLAAPAVMLISTAAAAAPTKSFTAASANLPGDTELVGTSNVKSVRSTKIFQKLFPMLLSSERDVKEANDKINKTCGIDPVKAIDDVTMGMDKAEKAGFYLALTGVSETKLIECVTKLAKSEDGATITSKKSGNITELKSDKQKESLFFGWLTGDVLVVTSDPTDKALIERMVGGKGALAKNTALATRMGRMNSDAAVSVAFVKSIPVDKSMTVKGGEINVVVSSGNAKATAVIEMGSKKEAEDLAKMVGTIPSLVGGSKPPKQLEKVAKNITARTNNAEVTISANATEDEILDLVNVLLGGGSSGSRP